MPELTAVETPKNAGFVQPKGGSRANKKRIEQDEAELKAQWNTSILGASPYS